MRAAKESLAKLGLIAIGVVTLVCGSQAETPEQLRRIMQSNICKADYTTIDPPTCEPSCKGNPSWTSCMNACFDSQKETREVVGEWNTWVKKCQQKPAAQPSTTPNANRSISRSESSSPDATKKKPEGSASPWAEKARKMEHKAAGAEDVNKQNAASTSQRAREDDKKAEDAAQEARERARRLEEERTARELAEARKWRCFGQNGNVRQGFEACKVECGAFYAPLFCRNQCYASSSGSIANGQSCFKMP
jgi:hypothetical protein